MDCRAGDSAPARGVARSAEPRPGELIDGRYLVEAPLGRGGMGLVLRAHDVDLDRHVAIKTISPGAPDSSAIARFFRHEARALAGLRSAHVVPIHAFGRHRGWFYFVMDLVSGQTLADELDACAAAGRTMPLRAALQLLEGIAAGLDDVHAAGLLHRDVKPENVVVEAGSRRPMLIDFGLVSRSSRAADVDGGEGGGGGTDAAARGADDLVHGGTPGYMAPELCLGHGAATAAVDVYAFACTAFEVLTGRQVFTSPSPGDLLARHALDTPPRPSSLRPELAPVDAVFAEALSKDPVARPRSCGALAQALTEGLCVAAVVERSFRPPPGAPTEAGAAPARDGLRLLVVDADSREARTVSRAAAFVFHGVRLRVRTTDAARKVLELVADAPPDLLVVESAAEGDGVLEVLMALRILHPLARLRVAVRTDEPAAAVAARMARFGPVDVLPRTGGIAVVLAALEVIAARQGLLAHRGGAPRRVRHGRSRLVRS